jgi:hypothetical protein
VGLQPLQFEFIVASTFIIEGGSKLFNKPLPADTKARLSAMPKLLNEDEGNVFLDGTFVPENRHSINLKFNRTPAEQAALSAARRQRRFENRQIKAYANGAGVNQPVSKEMPKVSSGAYYKTAGQKKREEALLAYASEHASPNYNYFRNKEDKLYIKKFVKPNSELRKSLKKSLKAIVKAVEKVVVEDEMIHEHRVVVPKVVRPQNWGCEIDFWGPNWRATYKLVMRELVVSFFKFKALQSTKTVIAYDVVPTSNPNGGVSLSLSDDDDSSEEKDDDPPFEIPTHFVIPDDEVVDPAPFVPAAVSTVALEFLSGGNVNPDVARIPPLRTHSADFESDSVTSEEVPRLVADEDDEVAWLDGLRQQILVYNGVGWMERQQNVVQAHLAAVAANLKMEDYQIKGLIERFCILWFSFYDHPSKKRKGGKHYLMCNLNPQQMAVIFVSNLMDIFGIRLNDVAQIVQRFVSSGLQALMQCKATMWLLYQEYIGLGVVPTAFADDATAFLKSFTRSELYEKGKSFLSKLAFFISTIQVTDSKILVMLKSILGPILTWTGTGSLLYEFVQLLKSIISGGYMWWTTGDWRNIFTADSASAWAIQADEAVMAVNDIVSKPCTREALSLLTDQIKHLIVRGAELRAIKGIANKETGIIRTIEHSLQEALTRLATAAPSMKPRPQPFVVQIHGPSCVGKTSTTHALINELLVALDKPRESSQIDWKNSFDKYDTTAKVGQVGCVMDEMCSQKAQFDQTNQVQRFMQICNIAPASVIKAGVEEKGSFWLQYKFVIVTSNIKNLNVHHRVDNPDAVLRRLEFLMMVSVREEFRIYEGDSKSNSFALDLNKLAGRDVIHAQQYQIIRRKTYNGSVIEEQCFPELCDITEGDAKWMSAPVGFKCLRDLFAQHRSRQDVALHHIDNYYSKPPCDVCKSLFCSCQVEPTGVMLGSLSDFISMYYFFALHWFLYYVFSRVKKINPRRVQEYFAAELRGMQTRVISSIRLRIDETYQKVKSTLLTGLVLSGTLLGAYVTYRYVFKAGEKVEPTVNLKWDDDEAEVSLGKSKPYMYPISETKNYPNRIIKVADGFSNVTKITTFEKLMKTIKACLVKVSVAKIGSTKSQQGVGIRFDSRYVLMNRHSFAIDGVTEYDNRLLEVKSINATFKPCVIMNQDIVELSGDLVIVHVASLNFPVASLRDFFCHPTGEKSFNSDDNYLIIPKILDADADFNFEVKQVSVSNLTAYSFNINDKAVEGVKFNLSEKLMVAGDSGSILVSASSVKILGVLCGGIGPSPYATATFQIVPEISDEVLDSINPFYTVSPTALSVPVVNQTSERSILDHFITPSSSAVYLGTLPNYVHNRPHTNIRKSAVFDLVKPLMESVPMIPILHPRVIETDEGHVYVDPFNVSCAILNTHEGIEPPVGLVLKAFEDFVSVLDDIPVDIAKKGGPLTTQQAINGAHPFDRMPVNTAAGIPLGGKKKDYLFQNSDGSYSFREGVEEAYLAYRKEYIKGRGRPIMSAHLKDEVKSVKKILAGLERMFNGSPFFFTVLSREFLMPIIVFIMDHNREFEHCVGINCMDPKQWGQLYEDLKTHGYIFDGDFAKFDLRHLRTVLLCFINFCVMIAKKYLDYSDFDIRMVVQLLTDMIYYIVCVKGDLVEFVQGFCSGAIITVIINSFVVCIYIRLAWFMKGFTARFRSRNVLRVYGDDNVVNTKEVSFTFLVIRDTLKEFGLVYTPSDKSDNPAPFSSIENIAFLKRKFVEAEVRGQKVVLCPLEEQSILKSLLYVKCPKSEEKVQIAKNIVDAQKQYWYHGPEKFHSWKETFRTWTVACDISLAEEGSNSALRWMSDDELADQYLAQKMTIAFT